MDKDDVLCILAVIILSLFVAAMIHYGKSSAIESCKNDCILINGTYVRHYNSDIGVPSRCICMINGEVKNIW